jgi:hypothetical protein
MSEEDVKTRPLGATLTTHVDAPGYGVVELVNGAFFPVRLKGWSIIFLTHDEGEPATERAALFGSAASAWEFIWSDQSKRKAGSV